MMTARLPASVLRTRSGAARERRPEPYGSDDFTPLWSGQAARLGRELPAGELTVRLAKRALPRAPSLGDDGC